jgi:dTDP-4-amino-4,6-dideoxygalactose transaminase
MPDLQSRTDLINHAKAEGVGLTFHYVPLHLSPAGEKFGRYTGDFLLTRTVSDTLVRLPLFSDMTSADEEKVVHVLNAFVKTSKKVQ